MMKEKKTYCVIFCFVYCTIKIKNEDDLMNEQYANETLKKKLFN